MERGRGILLIIFAVCAIGLLCGVACERASAEVVMDIYEFQITTNNASQQNPDVYNKTVVYQDNRNGNWDIYAYTLAGSFSPETRITTNTKDQISPAIDKNRVVYMDNRNGNWDIYLYDLVNHTETRITTDVGNQQFPDISGDRIVWEDDRYGIPDVYVYDLNTHTETRIRQQSYTSDNRHPAISGDLIVYTQDELGLPPQIWYMYLGSRGGPTEWFAGDPHPAVDGNRVVAEAESTVNSLYPDAITLEDWSTGLTWRDPFLSYQKYPDICGDYIAWMDDRNGNWDIYMYQVARQEEKRVTTDSTDQWYPAVSSVGGNYIVWQDLRNGNWDIYGASVGYRWLVTHPAPQPSPPTPEKVIERMENLKGLLGNYTQIPASDIAGANAKVRENRRNTLLNELNAVIHSIKATSKKTDNYRGAIAHLDAILDKTDGCVQRGTPDTIGSGYTPDWIINCPSQETMFYSINGSIRILQELMEGSPG